MNTVASCRLIHATIYIHPGRYIYYMQLSPFQLLPHRIRIQHFSNMESTGPMVSTR